MSRFRRSALTVAWLFVLIALRPLVAGGEVVAKHLKVIQVSGNDFMDLNDLLTHDRAHLIVSRFGLGPYFILAATPWCRPARDTDLGNIAAGTEVNAPWERAGLVPRPTKEQRETSLASVAITSPSWKGCLGILPMKYLGTGH